MRKDIYCKKRTRDKVILFASALILSAIPVKTHAQTQTDTSDKVIEENNVESVLHELDTYTNWLDANDNYSLEQADTLAEATKLLFIEYLHHPDTEKDLPTFSQLIKEELNASLDVDYIENFENWIINFIEESTGLKFSDWVNTVIGSLDNPFTDEVEDVEIEEDITLDESEYPLEDEVHEELDPSEDLDENEPVVNESEEKEFLNEVTEEVTKTKMTTSVSSFNVNASEDSRKEELYLASTTGGATARWRAALEGYRLYPEESAFHDQLRFLAGRMLVLGDQQMDQSNFESALSYYRRVTQGPIELFQASMLTTAETKVASATNEIETSNSNRLREELIAAATTGGASSRWHAAMEGYKVFPNEIVFQEQLIFLSQRMLSLGNSELANKNYSGATMYYNRILNGPTELFDQEVVIAAENNRVLSDPVKREEKRNQLLAAASSGGASPRWHAAIEGYSLFPDDVAFQEHIRFLAGRMISLGNSELNNRNFSGAETYFNRVINGPIEVIGSQLNNQAQSNLELVESRKNDSIKNDLIQAATSGGASSRWHAAIEGYSLFPDENRFHTALRFLAERMMILGKEQHENGNFSSAVTYYSRIVNGPTNLFDNQLVNQASAYLELAQGNNRLVTKASLLRQSTSGGASARWHAAVEGYNLFPEEIEFQNQLKFLASRMLTLGTDEHRQNNFDNALIYYRRITSGPTHLFDSSVVTSAHAYRNQAEARNSLVTRESVIQSATTGGASARFGAALEGYKWFNNDSEIIELLRTNANRMLNLGEGHHSKGEFDSALVYYNRLAQLDDNFNEINSKIRTNRYFAENKLFLVNSIYYTSTYAHTLEEMLDAQMRRNPQTDAYGGGWQTARREDVRRFLDPSNFLPNLSNDTGGNQQIRITTSNLNVRSQPNTNGSILGQVHLNDVYDIQGSQNGWYQISFNNRTGWVSGSFVSEISVPREFAIDEISGRVTASSLNVRSGPGTSHSIVGSLRSGDTVSILNQQNEWINIQRGNLSGWVHSDFISLTSSINRDALQFLILSGSAGISVNDLNKELAGKGILENQGAAFIEASRRHNINEIYLLAHALLETGNGRSELATGILVSEVDGKPVEPKVVYNMFGIGAFDATAKRSGSEYAYKQGWDTPEKSIIGGAEWISRQYVNHPTYKQDTLYKMRWNPSTPGVHQYATDIGWASKQTRSLEYIVELSQKYNFVLRFDIPKFK